MYFNLFAVIFFCDSQIVPSLASESTSSWLLNLLTQSPKSLMVFLLSGMKRCFRLTLYIYSPKPGIHHFYTLPWWGGVGVRGLLFLLEKVMFLPLSTSCFSLFHQRT